METQKPRIIVAHVRAMYKAIESQGIHVPSGAALVKMANSVTIDAARRKYLGDFKRAYKAALVMAECWGDVLKWEKEEIPDEVGEIPESSLVDLAITSFIEISSNGR